MQKFKSEISAVQDRKEESEKLLISHPEKIPVIVEPHNSSSNSYHIKQNKFLVPRLYTFHEFIYLLRKKLLLPRSEALYITVAYTNFPSLSRNMNSIYSEYKDSDGFLYVCYSSEAIWG